MDKTPETGSATTSDALELERRITALLSGQNVRTVAINNPRELVTFFQSGDRLFVYANSDLELSVT